MKDLIAVALIIQFVLPALVALAVIFLGYLASLANPLAWTIVVPIVIHYLFICWIVLKP